LSPPISLLYAVDGWRQYSDAISSAQRDPNSLRCNVNAGSGAFPASFIPRDKGETNFKAEGDPG
jgi:hypothetical protein